MTSERGTPRFEWNALCVDCAPADFEEMIAFYCAMLGWRVFDKEPRWAAIGPETGMDILIQAEDWYVPPVWPEEVPAQTKMMHLEVRVDDVEAAVARAIEVGAREAPRQPPGRDPNKLRVMLDPAGHPLCLWS